MALDFTHDPSATSWVASANGGSDFAVQNLPLAVFRRRGDLQYRGGVAIGEQIVDLAALAAAAPFEGLAAQALLAASQPKLNGFMHMGPPAWQALREALFRWLQAGATPQPAFLRPQDQAEYTLPTQIGDYTDFYTSYHHALNIGKLFGIPEVSLNFHHIPTAYHGRASSVVISGTPVRRPVGQSKKPDAAAPTLGPCQWLDYELELGLYIGHGNRLGDTIALESAEQHLFGICLLNDWSARDIQGWEMQPLGPFQAKNFSTSVSPWIVTMAALTPFRCRWQREAAFPQPLAYLDTAGNRDTGGIDIQLEVGIQPATHRTPAWLTRTSFRHQHWTPAQMLTHHTVGGCNLQPGDLLGSGTISGPTAAEAGAMMELAQAGRAPVALGDSGDSRGFLADGDTVVFRGWCEAPGWARIGFGECRGTVLPARTDF
ncbi:MAG: fumarylacetoacetase [Rubrivivax sp.]